MNCKRNVPTVKKRKVEMGVDDWDAEISRPFDCKKLSFVALFFIQRMAIVNYNGAIARKRSFVVLLFVFNILKMRCIYEIKQSKRRRRTFQ